MASSQNTLKNGPVFIVYPYFLFKGLRALDSEN